MPPKEIDIPDELIDQLLAGRESPEEITGPDGLLKELTKRVGGDAVGLAGASRGAFRRRCSVTLPMRSALNRCATRTTTSPAGPDLSGTERDEPARPSAARAERPGLVP